MKQNDNKQQSKKKVNPVANPLEAIRDLSGPAAQSLKKDVLNPFAGDFANQIFGRPRKNYSGEISPGGSLEMQEVLTGEHEEKERLAKQVTLQRRLIEQEKVYIEKKSNELRIQIKAIHEEVVKLAKVTPKLSREVEIAAIQTPVEPSTYDLFFLEKIFEFIKSFREKIEKASIWLHATNRRARKRNVWGANYKKHGAKYLLSGEHYLTRSAG